MLALPNSHLKKTAELSIAGSARSPKAARAKIDQYRSHEYRQTKNGEVAKAVKDNGNDKALLFFIGQSK